MDASCVLAMVAPFLVLLEKLLGGREIPEEVRVELSGWAGQVLRGTSSEERLPEVGRGVTKAAVLPKLPVSDL